MSNSSAPSPVASPTSAAPAIAVERLTTGYRDAAAIEDVSFALPKGAFLGLLGPNGSGKSTLIKALVGLLPAWGGSVRVLGAPPREARARIGYMPQAEDVDWHFPVTAREVVGMGLYRRSLGPERWRGRERGRVMAALERLSATDLADRQIDELSGGQQRRVLLARALVKAPDVLLLDEPTAGLDPPAERELLDLLGDLAAGGATVVVSTHDITCVNERCDCALCLNRTVMAFGPPAEAITEESLDSTFPGHVLVLGRGGRQLAVAPHDGHERPEGER